MKKNTIAKLLTAALCTGLIAGMTTGCGSASSASGESGQVIVYNWGEYIDPDTITMFEEETGIHVVYEEFETKEQAMKREYAIKQLGRKEKQKLIAGKKVKLSDERKEKED